MSQNTSQGEYVKKFYQRKGRKRDTKIIESSGGPSGVWLREGLSGRKPGDTKGSRVVVEKGHSRPGHGSVPRRGSGERPRPGSWPRREKGPGKKKHGGDEKEDREIEGFDVGHQGRKAHASGSKGQTPNQGDQKYPQRPGISQKPEEGKDDHHQDRSHQRTTGAPDDFAQDNLFRRQWRGHNGVKGFLIVHPHIGGVGGFKKGVLHDIDGQNPRGNKGRITDHPSGEVQPSHQVTQSRPKGQKIKNRF